MELAVALTTLVISLMTGLLVFQKNPRSGTHVYFALLVFFISIYPVFNYLAVNSTSSSDALTWAKLILVVSIPQGPLLYFFAKTFPERSFIFNKKRQIIITFWVFINILLAITGLIFNDVSVQDKVVSIQPGPLIPSFGLLHISTIIAGLAVLFKKYRHSINRDRQQLAYVFYGIFISFTLTFLITFVLPILLKNTILLAISPLFLALSVIAVAYAIIRHHLLDIKAVVARSVAYILSIGLLTIIYALVSSVLLNTILSKSSSTGEPIVANAVILIVAVILYPSVKIFFNRLTNRIFYRDAYDPEELLDELNSAIVGNIELGVLLRHSTAIIQKNLKSEHCFIEVLRTSNTPSRIIGVGTIDLDKEETQYVINKLENSARKILVTDHLEPDEHKLRDLLSEKSIAMIIRLVPSGDISGKAIAHLIIGTKKSGNVYDKQDLHTIDIISDELLIAIENALRFEEIQGFAAKLQAEVNTATAKLQRTNKKLRELDETKDEFISMASHQLRTPLTSVKGYMSMVLEGDAGKISKQQRELLNQAFVSSQRMVYLIADLLNVSRLKTGKFIIESTPTNLAEVIEGEIEQLRETAKAKKIDIEYEKPKDFPTLALDETKIRQVIMNFADNAIYYTPRDGKVKVELSEDKSNIYFKVIDNGLGVPKHDIPHLFTKFYRASNARKARPDGTGLGLFMAKKVIDSQGGNLLFESEENKGSMFGFCFQKKKHNLKRHSK